MEWETSKENFQPLKQGRHPAKILQEIAKAPAKAQACAEQDRREYWKELEQYSGNDPLEVWLRFIKWTQDTFKSGGHKAELLPLLERCTRELQADDRYKNDIRYLRVWIQYADLLPEPRDVFTFLKEHGIGQDFAMYYIAYAAFSELRGNFTRAESIYQQGLERLAHPIDRLRTKHQEFQQRMERRALRKAQEGGNVGLPEDADLAPARGALNTLRSTKHRAPRSRQTAGSGAGGVAHPKRKGIFGPGAEPAKQSGGLEIFVDDEFKADGRTSSSEGLPSSAGAGPSAPAWAHLGSFEQTRKENVQQASTWVGAKLKQKKALVVPAAEALPVHEDEELAAQSSTAPAGHVAPAGTLRRRLDAGDLQEHLRHDPLRLHKDAAATEASAGVQRVPSADTPAPPQAPPAPKRKREESFALDNTALTTGPDELSFEELRGQQWQARQAQPTQAAQSSPGSAVNMELGSPVLPSRDQHMQAGSQLDSQPSDSLARVQGNLTAAAEQADLVRLGRSASLSGSPEAPSSGAVLQQPGTPTSQLAKPGQATAGSRATCSADRESLPEPMQCDVACSATDVTLATQAAFSELNGMFTSSPPHTAGHDRQIQRPGIAITTMQAQQAMAGSADVTMVTRNTFDSVNAAFQGALPQNCAWPQRAAPARPRMSLAGPMTARLLDGVPAGLTHRAALGPEPTVTISTQAAFSTLNDMFRGELPRECTAGRAAGNLNKPMHKRPASAEGFPVYEDTQLLPGALGNLGTAQPAGSQGEALQMYEDTQFLGGPAPSPLPAGGQPGAPEMQLYEDTQFMQENTTAMPARHNGIIPQRMQTRSPGLHAYEDTRLTQENGPAAAQPSLGFQLYEDTQFISTPAAASALAARMQPLALQADMAPVDSLGTPMMPCGHEGHTAYLAENIRPAIPHAPPREEFDSPTKDKENGGCSPKLGSGQRLLIDPAVEAGALRDISAARAAQLGIRINETGCEREDEDDQSAMMDRLRLEGSNEQDDFEVFSNVTARQLFHANWNA